MNRRVFRAFVIVGLALWLVPVARAGAVYTVRMNTTAFVGHPAGPFAINFQLTDGHGTGNGNSTVLLSNFQFGTGGSAVGFPQVAGGAGGSIQGQVVLTDNSFLNYLTQTFQPGETLSFTVETIGSIEGGVIPDGFSFAILDRTGAEVPTLGFFDAFIGQNINSSSAMPMAFASDPGRAPAAGGPALNVPILEFSSSSKKRTGQVTSN